MKQKISFAAFIFVIGIAIAGFVAYVASKEAYRNKKIEREIESLKTQAQQMKAENNKLQEKIAYFDTSEFKEKVAKEKLNLQKPEEEVVIIKPSPSREDPQDSSGDKVDSEVVVKEAKEANYKKWWNYFFSYTSES